MRSTTNNASFEPNPAARGRRRRWAEACHCPGRICFGFELVACRSVTFAKLGVRG